MSEDISEKVSAPPHSTMNPTQEQQNDPLSLEHSQPECLHIGSAGRQEIVSDAPG